MKTHVKRISICIFFFVLGIFCFLPLSSYRTPTAYGATDIVYDATDFAVGNTISSDQMFVNATGKTIILSVSGYDDVNVWDNTEFSLASVVGAGKTLKIDSVQEIDGITIKFSVETVPQHTHSYVETLVTSATCTGSAAYVMRCECGQEYGNEYQSGDPLGHAITAFDISQNPTKTTYTEGETFKADGLEVVAVCAREGCAGFTLTAEQYSVAKTELAVGDDSVAVTIDKCALPTADYSDVSTYVLSIPVTVTAKPQLTVPDDAITSVECVYDGKEHAIEYDLNKICEANGTTEVEIFFKTEPSENYREEEVTRKDVGETTVYWALTASTHTRADGTATIKITRRTATVTVHDVSITTGEEYVDPTFASEGLLAEDEEYVLVSCPTFQNEPGTYPVTATLGENADNYDLIVNAGTCTVTEPQSPGTSDPEPGDPDVDPEPVDPEPVNPKKDTKAPDTVPDTRDNVDKGNNNSSTSSDLSSQTENTTETPGTSTLSDGATLAICIGAVVVLVALPFLIRKLVKRKGK